MEQVQMSTLLKNASTNQTLLIHIIRLVIAGFALGYLHSYQWVLFFLCSFYAGIHLYRHFKVSNANGLCYLTGFLLTACVGTSGELWGTYNDYWTYYDIPSAQLIPAWLPVAWGLLYLALHSLEQFLSSITSNRTLNFLFINIACILFTTTGEYIPIYMNVWNYHWPYQLMGVPVLASVILYLVHISIFITMSNLNIKYQFNNGLYNVCGPIFDIKKFSLKRKQSV